MKDGTDIYIFPNELVYVFDSKEKDPRSPFGQLSEVKKPSDKWKGFNSKENGFLIIENEVHVIYPNETSKSWKPDGTPIYQIVTIYTEEEYTRISNMVTTTTEPSFRSRGQTNFSSPGTAVVLPMNRIALVIEDKVILLLINTMSFQLE